MIELIGKVIRKAIRKIGFDVIQYTGKSAGVSETNREICNAVKPYTMTNTSRVNVLIDSVRYIVQNNIEGCFVECGVWKGGSMMAVALALKEMGVENRDLFLYDTFTGLSRPDDVDVTILGENATEIFKERQISEDSSDWCLSPLEEVRENLLSTGYPEEKIHFIKGKVEDMIPGNLPSSQIALLRLDTDFYSSTKHELVHMFPLLVQKGILILDDYGFWKGARRAVDEYISENEICIFLSCYIDQKMRHGGRIAVKM